MLRLLWWSNGLDHASSAGDTGWIPCWGTKVLHAMGVAKKKNKKKPHTHQVLSIVLNTKRAENHLHFQQQNILCIYTVEYFVTLKMD